MDETRVTRVTRVTQEHLDIIEELRLILKEADDYLNTNDMTSIGHNSILHKKFHELSKRTEVYMLPK